MDKAKEYVENMSFDEQCKDTRPFQIAAPDKYNTGVFDTDGKRNPNKYVNHVNDLLYADVKEHMLCTVACSIVAVNEVFGGSHKYQTKILSKDKLSLWYTKQRILLGHYPNTRSMTVKSLPRRQEKILEFLTGEEWITTRTKATLRELAQVIGIVQLAPKFYL